MFSKQSRYHQVPDAAVSGQDGRTVVAKDLRVLPEVTGTFTHVLGDGDRLDLLASLYYGQPLHYWRICDANPAFLSPLALIGQEALVDTSYQVTAPDDALWARALAALSATTGVEDVTVRLDITLGHAVQRLDGEDVTVVTEHLTPVVTVTHNRATVDSGAIADAIEGAGFTVESWSVSGPAGRRIVVPVAAGGQAGS
ncbi:hypothetical protein OHB05_00910 [Streptomyces sp. NBC_00638]|uniref:heavy-metal-associated domain-containing protein n=1 Tax=unclassified Streptomyces TaxID=2593676 RepID=UPI00225A4A88|nr:hypothetical protein [Streptomyces sp. NBC_00638]MCX5001189.1 hypothetical protein [Streptomyces sp. NBC_00638]